MIKRCLLQQQIAQNSSQNDMIGSEVKEKEEARRREERLSSEYLGQGSRSYNFVLNIAYDVLSLSQGYTLFCVVISYLSRVLNMGQGQPFTAVLYEGSRSHFPWSS